LGGDGDRRVESRHRDAARQRRRRASAVGHLRPDVEHRDGIRVAAGDVDVLARRRDIGRARQRRHRRTAGPGGRREAPVVGEAASGRPGAQHDERPERRRHRVHAIALGGQRGDAGQRAAVRAAAAGAVVRHAPERARELLETAERLCGRARRGGEHEECDEGAERWADAQR
jgi:hypothetical protein